MKQLLSLCAGLLLACGLAGCCCSPGYYDPACGVMYGGGWEPCCLPNPFHIFTCCCPGGPVGGIGGYAMPPVGNYCDPCGKAPCVAPVGHQPAEVSMHDGGYVYSTPEVMPYTTPEVTPYTTPEVLPSMPPGSTPEALPSMPPGVYEQAIPPAPSSEPMPEAIPDDSTGSFSTPTIIYGPPKVISPPSATSQPQVQVQKWVPAQF